MRHTEAENRRARNERGEVNDGSSLKYEPPPQCCYSMIAFTSSRTYSACQCLEQQQSRRSSGICRHLVR